MSTSLTEHVLKLLAEGKLSKEATADALEFKKQSTDSFNSSNFAPMDVLKGIGLSAAAIKGTDVLGKGINYLVNKVTEPNKDAIFQDLIANHPSLKGKDPVRAKANLDYILAEAPHLADHPLILGDQVANMTALGATDPMTLKTLAETTKARHDTHKDKSDFLPPDTRSQIGNFARDYYLAGKERQPVKPAEPSPTDTALTNVHARGNLRSELLAKRDKFKSELEQKLQSISDPAERARAQQAAEYSIADLDRVIRTGNPDLSSVNKGRDRGGDRNQNRRGK